MDGIAICITLSPCVRVWPARLDLNCLVSSQSDVSLGPRPFLYVDLCACAGKGEGQERKGLGTRQCKQFHLWSNTISDNCTHVTEYGVQAAVDLSHARRLGVYRSLYE